MRLSLIPAAQSWAPILLALSFLLAAQCPAAQELPPAFSPGSMSSSPWLHRDSGFIFRQSVAGFTRTEPVQYNESGTDVSVSYDFSNPKIVVTVYVYPTEGLTLDQEFLRRQEEIAAKYPAAKIDATDSIDVTPKRHPVQRATYTIPKMWDGLEGPMHSILLVGQQGKRFIEYRISYANSGGTAAEKAAKRFIAEFPWHESEPAP